MATRGHGSRLRVLAGVPLALVCALALALACVSAPALATKTRLLSTSFGGKGSADGLFEGAWGVAVGEASMSKPAEYVYVADRGGNRVEQFSSTGAFIAAWGWGVSDGKAEYEVCTSGCGPGIAGSGAGQLSSPAEIAVDNSTNPLDPSAGDVYVANFAENTIEKFGPDGEYIGQLRETTAGSPFPSKPCGVAVDPNGELWVYLCYEEIDNFSDATANEFSAERKSPFGASLGFAVDSEDNLYVERGDGSVGEITSSGAVISEAVDDEESNGVAVNLATSEAYIDNVTTVGVFSSSGSLIESFGGPYLGADGYGGGIAVSSATNTVYVSDATTDMVDVFAPSVLLPTVSIEAATGVEKKSGAILATLNGSVNPEGEAVTECYFEYGSSLPSGKTAPCEPSATEIGAGTGSVNVHAPASGLLPETTYLYKLVAVNKKGPISSANAEFKTPVAFGVAIEATTGVEKKSVAILATLNGSVNPGGEAITGCQFEYGPSLPSGKTVPCEPSAAGIGTGGEYVSIHATASGLLPDTTYRDRIVGENRYGPSISESAEFQTPLAVKGLGECGASGLLNEGATLHGTLEPEGVSTKWYFEYRKAGTGEPWSKSAEGGVENPIGKLVEPEESVAGLERNTTYDCRLVAYNTLGAGVGAEGAFTTALPPVVSGESFALVGFSDATLRARIDSFGAADSYRFEYGTTSAYGSSTPEVSISHPVRGEAGVSLRVLGLQPTTTYHFHVVVTEPDGGGTAAGADQTFTTFLMSGAELPDGRVYEMVSAPEDGGANVYVPEAGNGPFPTPTAMPFQASADGEAVAYAGAPSQGGNGDAGAGGGNEFVARLTPGGWVSQDAVPLGGGGSPVFLAFSSDLSAGILESREALSEGAPGGGFDVLYSTGGGGSYQPLFTEGPKHRSAEEFASAGTVGPKGAGLAFAGASADFSHVLFEANDALASEAGGEDPGVGANDLYDSVGGRPSLVDVLPAGEGGGPAPDATFGAPNETGDPADPPDFSHVISADGSRVFWTDLHLGLEEGHVYVRENGSTTVPVSEGTARYWTATPDGRYAFYTEGAGRESRLWRFDAEGAEREALTVADAGVLGVVGVNEVGEDGSYVYFVAEGRLMAGKNAEGREPLEGQPNLYLLHGGETSFIATLAPEDEGTIAYGGEGGSFGDWEPGLGHRTAEVTPNGHSVVFQSVLPLTKYDSEGLSEVFVYDSEAVGESVFCASCDPSGEPPPVTEVGGLKVKAAAYLPVSWSRTYQPRLISEDGSRVFFDTFEPLVAADPNSQQDVYEWERPGTGACGEHGGCEYLLSGGTSRSGSYLVDASANGDDVFFVSDAKLVPQDENESDHLYDDRVDGAQPSALPGCAGTSCQQTPLASPIFPAPPSATFAGVGNFPPSPPPAQHTTKTKTKAKKKARKHRKHRARHGKQAGAKRTGRS